MTMRHGSEDFFVEGEGLLTTQLGGRSGDAPDPVTDPDAPPDPTAPAARPANGAAVPAAARATVPFRFSRVGPKGRRLPDDLVRKVARAMVVGGGGAGDVPAGYTYLGQFIDHDLTMDVSRVRLGADITPAELVQHRSPSLDLDSLYGAGPADPESARFYEADGLHLRTGDTVAIGSDAAKAGHDLPRVGRGTGGRSGRR